MPAEGGGLGDEWPQVKRQRLQPSMNESPDSLVPANSAADLDSLMQPFQTPSQSIDGLGWNVPSAAPQGPIVPPSLGSSNLGEATPGYQESAHLGDLARLSSMFAASNNPGGQGPYGGLNCFLDSAMTDCSSNPSSFDAQSTISDLPQVFPIHRSSMSSVSASGQDRRRQSCGGHKQRKDPRSSHEYRDTLLSPFAADHIAMVNSNKTLISESLLRIYHDVLENNLGCWLAEDTCPYKMQRRRHEPVLIQPIADPGVQGQLEWGGAWSNRMYRRVKRLDRVAQSVNLIRLTASESRAASRALDLVIMAFATQWPQGDRREDETGREDDGSGGDFEQTLQRSIWEQANRALQEVSDVECYRVVFAELIFGLIQKPWSSHEYDERAAVGPRIGEQDENVKSLILPQVMDIIAQGGPPVFMERAARKVHALRFRFEAREAGFHEATRIGSNTASDEKAPQRLSTEERRTLGLLYWLAVMFDTLSSSINERPVVVSDEECQHDAAREAAGNHTKNSILNRRWELDLYAQDDPEQPSPLHWPCPYEAATRAIARSAAVKVLLFRHVSYLQNTLRNSEHGQAVEEIIHITISVYRYWNKTHGAFFRDLASNYESIPPRIKSWFPCIGIPWHLGCLMLADLIDFVDANGLGLDAASAERHDTDMAMRIRRMSSIELADLAAATTPREISGMGLKQLPDFHFAVNESPLLTEPWVVLLIRAFTKASLFHLAEAEKLQKLEWSFLGHESETLQASVRRGESCVRALRFLGTKSGMAEAISKVLSRSFDMYKKEARC